jgi:hypothetical protein
VSAPAGDSGAGGDGSPVGNEENAPQGGGSEAEVTREGLGNVRPGRDSRTWSGPGDPPGTPGDGSQKPADGSGKPGDGVGKPGDGTRKPREFRADHPGDSYYGQPIINPPVWEEREIAGYLFTGGLAGASSILAAGADLTGRPTLARGSRLMATGAISISLLALIKDLGRPQRFLNMLRVFKPTSPMSVGVWILVAYAPLTGAAAASDVLGRAPRGGRAAGLAAAALGSAVATYTAALISNTSVPAWREGRREMPILFAGSAASAAAGWGLVVAPAGESEPARRLAILGALVELGAEQALSRRLGMIAEALDEGEAGKRMKIAKALTVAGAIGAAASGIGADAPASAGQGGSAFARRGALARGAGLGGPRAGRAGARRLGGIVPRRGASGSDRARRALAIASGAALLAGSAFTRFGIFEGGMASARDPKYTVEPQRARVEAKRAATL